MSEEKCAEINLKGVEYLRKIIGDALLQGGKGTLLNIVEGCGLPERQEKAVKRLVVDWLQQQECFLMSVLYNICPEVHTPIITEPKR